MNAPRRRLAAILGLALLLGACAQPRLQPATSASGPQSYWHGKLALRMQSDMNSGTDNEPHPRSFFASFELSGSAEAGELLLLSPIGTTVAQLRWTPRQALLRGQGKDQAFGNLDALAQEATGAALPIAALFEWLQGHTATAEGWQADLTQLDAGRLLARRLEPAAELRLILEP